MLSLLDNAVASHVFVNRLEALPHISALWSEVYHEWRDIAPRWADAAETFAKAATHEGSERTEFLSDETFANSYCRLAIQRLVQRPSGEATS